MAVKLATMNDVLSKFNIFSTYVIADCNNASPGFHWLGSNSAYGPEYEGILLVIPMTRTENWNWSIPGEPIEFQIAWEMTTGRMATRYSYVDGTYIGWGPWKSNS